MFPSHDRLGYMPVGMEAQDSDNKIIAIALRLKIEGNQVAIVSRDLNMRVKCDSFGIECYDYQPAQAVKSVDNLYTGCADVIVADSVIDDFYAGQDVFLEKQSLTFILITMLY